MFMHHVYEKFIDCMRGKNPLGSFKPHNLHTPRHRTPLVHVAISMIFRGKGGRI
jgi:hypothetical protein